MTRAATLLALLLVLGACGPPPYPGTPPSHPSPWHYGARPAGSAIWTSGNGPHVCTAPISATPAPRSGARASTTRWGSDGALLNIDTLLLSGLL